MNIDNAISVLYPKPNNMAKGLMKFIISFVLNHDFYIAYCFNVRYKNFQTGQNRPWCIVNDSQLAKLKKSITLMLLP